MGGTAYEEIFKSPKESFYFLYGTFFMQKIVVNLILVKDNSILIAQRAKTKKIAPSKYHLPWGHVEYWEHPEKAIIREIKEEFNIDIFEPKVFDIFSYITDNIHTIWITFIEKYFWNKDIFYDKSDNENIVWMGKDDINQYFEKDDFNIDIIRKFYS